MQTKIKVRLLIMKLKTEMEGMLVLLTALEDINLSSWRKTGVQTYYLFAKVLSVANFLSYVPKLFYLTVLFIAIFSLLTLPEL